MRASREELVERFDDQVREAAALRAEVSEGRAHVAEATALAEERLAERNDLAAVLQDQQDKALDLRRRLGAEEGETFSAFIERLGKERDLGRIDLARARGTADGYKAECERLRHGLPISPDSAEAYKLPDPEHLPSAYLQRCALYSIQSARVLLGLPAAA